MTIDNVISDPESVIEDAARRRFSSIGPFYPGIRTPLPAQMTRSLCESIQNQLSVWFGAPGAIAEAECFYSIVSTPRNELSLIQRLPHFDGVNPNLFALLIYLDLEQRGGTSFYRHRSTGYETITGSRFSKYESALTQELRNHGEPKRTYIDDGRPYFEEIVSVEPAFNRMLIYRGCSLHSGKIPAEAEIPPSPTKGRLTITGFVKTGP